MLKTSVTKFNEDLNQLSSHIRDKQTSQIRQTLKKKAYDQAGIPIKIAPIVKPLVLQQHAHQQPIIIQEQVIFQAQPSIKIEQQLPETLVVNTPSNSSHSHQSNQLTLNRLNVQPMNDDMDILESSLVDGDVKIEYGGTTEVSS